MLYDAEDSKDVELCDPVVREIGASEDNEERGNTVEEDAIVEEVEEANEEDVEEDNVEDVGEVEVEEDQDVGKDEKRVG